MQIHSSILDYSVWLCLSHIAANHRYLRTKNPLFAKILQILQCEMPRYRAHTENDELCPGNVKCTTRKFVVGAEIKILCFIFTHSLIHSVDAIDYAWIRRHRDEKFNNGRIFMCLSHEYCSSIYMCTVIVNDATICTAMNFHRYVKTRGQHSSRSLLLFAASIFHMRYGAENRQQFAWRNEKREKHTHTHTHSHYIFRANKIHISLCCFSCFVVLSTRSQPHHSNGNIYVCAE